MTRLAATRGYLELSRDEVQQRTGIDDLGALEAGERAPTDLELARLSRVYSYSPGYLRGDEDGAVDDAIQVVARMGDLTAEDHAEALRFAIFLRYAGD